MTKSYVYQHQKVNLINNNNLIILMENVFQKGGSFRFKASGFSMWPFIRNGDVITLIPSRKKNLQNGDIVAFISQNNNKLTVHRMIATRDNLYLIKGDNTSTPDGWINKEKIVGIVTKIERRGRSVKDYGKFKGFISYTSRINFLQISTRIARIIFTPIIKVRNCE